MELNTASGIAGERGFLCDRNAALKCCLHCCVAVCSVRGSGDAEVGTKHTKRCTVQLDNQLKIIYNWVAPEVLFGEQFTFTSDIYSLCAVLWEANTGMLMVNI